jgi:hypothetical protein
MDESKVTFKVAAGVPLPVRVTAAQGVGVRVFDSAGPHECTAAEWPSLASSHVSVVETEKRADGQTVIVGHKTVRVFELAVAETGESKLKVFGRRKEPEAE